MILQDSESLSLTASWPHTRFGKSGELNSQPVSFLISSISSSLSNVDALDPIVKSFLHNKSYKKINNTI